MTRIYGGRSRRPARPASVARGWSELRSGAIQGILLSSVRGCRQRRTSAIIEVFYARSGASPDRCAGGTKPQDRANSGSRVPSWMSHGAHDWKTTSVLFTVESVRSRASIGVNDRMSLAGLNGRDRFGWFFCAALNASPILRYSRRTRNVGWTSGTGDLWRACQKKKYLFFLFLQWEISLLDELGLRA